MWLTSPITWPISKLLDYFLGTEHSTLFRRAEFKELITIHANMNQGPLSRDETNIIKGALEVKGKNAKECMTPLEKVFMLDIKTPLNKETVSQMIQNGFSRIPVYDGSRNNIKGVLLIKSLITLLVYDIGQKRPGSVEELELHPCLTFSGNTPLYTVLGQFQTGRSHMGIIVSEGTQQILGILSMEDILEELLQTDIVDETDVFVDITRQIKVNKQAQAAVGTNAAVEGYAAPNSPATSSAKGIAAEEQANGSMAKSFLDESKEPLLFGEDEL